MQTYQTEDEQVEALKKWFRDNGRTLITVLLLVAVVVIGGYGWKQRQLQQQETASVEYQNLLEAMRQLEIKSTPEALATTKHLADTLKKDFSATSYAQFAALFKARLAVQDNDLGEAETELRWVLEHKPAVDIKWLAQLRLARVLHAKGDSKGALALLDEKEAGGYASSVLQLKGDIAKASGDVDGARNAYQKAHDLDGKQANPLNDPLLEMKMRDLAMSIDAPAEEKADAATHNTDDAAVTQ